MTVVLKKDIKKYMSELLDKVSHHTHPQATILGFSGDLGAGKTTAASALGEALGVTEVITSPTFILMKRYKTHHARYTSLVHIDAYRIEKEQELTSLGFLEWCKEPGVLVVIEWPERVLPLLPKETVWVDFSVVSENERSIFVR